MELALREWRRHDHPMCNLYNLKVKRWELVAYYQANDEFRREIELEKDYVSPGREGFVARNHDGQRVLDSMRWGFPHWQAGQKDIVNVRNYSSRFWHSALSNPERRCLVPSTAFQEWSVEPDPATGKKSKHWFSVPSRPIFSMAGVWRPTETGPRFAFLTCGYGEEEEAVSAHIVGKIHPKAIPVLLHDEDHETWLSAPLDEALTLACAFPSQLMAMDI